MKEITLFGRALKVTDMSFSMVNSLAIAKGYIIHPDCCNRRVVAWLQTLPNNLNTTFYKSWREVTDKTRTELALHQLFHYATTYGTDYTAEPFIPNDQPDQMVFTDAKVILPITREEIQEKIQKLFDSGIALKEQTIVDCIELCDELLLTIHIETIRNKEVLMHVCKRMNTVPSDPTEMVRFLVFLYTSKTLLIKDAATIARIKSTMVDIEPWLEKFGMERLASVFYRFKPLFLAMKRGTNKPLINQLRRLAVTEHKPYVFGFWEKILSDSSLLPKLSEKLKTCSNYKKVLILETIRIRAKRLDILPVLVRNQKLYVRTPYNTPFKEYYSLVYSLVYGSLIESLAAKKCTVRMHKHIKLALPTSEKSFIGAIPFGSYVDTAEHTVVGINWRAEEGADDLDLSLIDTAMNKVGWNASYYNEAKTIAYSGDMTSAYPEATELIYCKNGVPDSVVSVNLYNGRPDSAFSLFLATTSDDYTVQRNTMVDPDTIRFMTKVECNSQQTMIGIFHNGRFQFAHVRTGNARVSDGNTVTSSYIRYISETADCHLNLETVLKDAGYTLTYDSDEAVKLDLSVMDKSLLIDLLS